MTTDDRPIILLGDIHGSFSVIMEKLKSGVLDDTTLIQIGDFGLGFRAEDHEDRIMGNLDQFLIKHNCELLVIRGNHDNPKWWRDPKLNQEFNSKYSNITLIPDYYTKEINGLRILFVGGAVSIDRYNRSIGISYWLGEEVQEPKFPIQKHDILIAHTTSNVFNEGTKGGKDFIKWVSHYDENLENDLKRERALMDHIIKTSEVKEVYSGHFHNDVNQTVDGVKYRCIDINEFYQLR